MSDVLSVLSGIVLLAAFFPYLRAAIRKETKPRKATWFIWALGDWIILLGMLAKGTWSGLLVAACIGATTAFFISLFYGERGLAARDKVCVALSLMAIGLWQYFGESNLGIAFSCLSLMIAAWPMYVSAWENPQNEDKKGWILFNLSSFLAVLAIRNATFADIAPPVVFLVIDGPMLYLLFVRPHLQQLRESLEEAMDQ